VNGKKRNDNRYLGGKSAISLESLMLEILDFSPKSGDPTTARS